MSKPPSELARRVAGEVVDEHTGLNSIAANLTRAEIDMQIATAKKYPRNITTVQRQIETLATLDEETAAECMYTLKRGTKFITGPSIRFAEIVLQAWGNCRVAARITNENKTHLEATGIYHDLETNMAVQKSLAVRITMANGQRYGDDMLGVASAAGTSKALRNAIMGGVPKGVWNGAYLKAQEVARGDAATLTKRREDAMKALKGLGAEPKDVYELLGVKGLADISLDVMLQLRGIFTTLSTGEDTLANMLAEARKKPEPLAARVGQGEPQGDAQAREGFSRDHVARETDEPPRDAKKAAAKAPAKAKPAAGQAEANQQPAAAEPETPAHNAETGEVIEGEATEKTETPAEEEVDPEDAGDADESERQEDEELAEVFAGPAPAGVDYLLASEEPDANDHLTLYRDGEVFSKIDMDQAVRRYPTYDAHPEAAEDNPPADDGNGPADDEDDDEENRPTLIDELKTMESWLAVKAKVVALSKSDDFLELDPKEQAKIRVAIWEVVLDIKKKYRDPVDHALDPTAFRLWIETQHGKDGVEAIQGTWRTLKREPNFTKLTEGTQEAFRRVVEARIVAEGGKV